MAKRLGRSITYHKRAGKPVIHTSKSGRKYIMVRAKGGGVKRLYEGSKYWETTPMKTKRLMLG